MLLIPAIDLRHGRCVRLFQGDFAAETRYEHEPHELLVRYRGLGASWLHVVDLDGAKEGVLSNRSIIVALASQRAVRLQVGGIGGTGVRLQANGLTMRRREDHDLAKVRRAVDAQGRRAGRMPNHTEQTQAGDCVGRRCRQPGQHVVEGRTTKSAPPPQVARSVDRMQNARRKVFIKLPEPLRRHKHHGFVTSEREMAEIAEEPHE